MNREQLYQSRESANRMEAVMLAVSVVAVIGAVLTPPIHGWLVSLGFLILASIAFALSRVFDLLGDLLTSKTMSDRKIRKQIPEGTPKEA